MKKLDLYWMENPDWFDYTDDEENPVPFLTEKATPEAKASFARYSEQIKSKSV